MNILGLAIKKLRPTSEFSLSNDDYATIKWDVLEGSAPTLAEVEKAIIEVKKEHEQNVLNQEKKKQELLDRLGLTVDEASLLLS